MSTVVDVAATRRVKPNMRAMLGSAMTTLSGMLRCGLVAERRLRGRLGGGSERRRWPRRFVTDTIATVMSRPPANAVATARATRFVLQDLAVTFVTVAAAQVIDEEESVFPTQLA